MSAPTPLPPSGPDPGGSPDPRGPGNPPVPAAEVAPIPCHHIHMTKVANMNVSTYRCDKCLALFDVTLFDVAPPTAEFPKE